MGKSGQRGKSKTSLGELANSVSDMSVSVGMHGHGSDTGSSSDNDDLEIAELLPREEVLHLTLETSVAFHSENYERMAVGFNNLINAIANIRGLKGRLSVPSPDGVCSPLPACEAQMILEIWRPERRAAACSCRVLMRILRVLKSPTSSPGNTLCRASEQLNVVVDAHH